MLQYVLTKIYYLWISQTEVYMDLLTWKLQASKVHFPKHGFHWLVHLIHFILKTKTGLLWKRHTGMGLECWCERSLGQGHPNVREADGTDGPLIVMLLPKCCSWSFQVPLQPPLESKYWPVIRSWPKSPEEKSPRGSKGWGVFWEGISSKIKRDPWEEKPSFSAMWHLMPRQQQPFSEPKEMGSPMSQSPKIPENIDGRDQVMVNPIQL